MITLRPSNPEALPAGTSYTFLELHWLEGCSLAFLITIYLLWQLNEPVFSDRAVKQAIIALKKGAQLLKHGRRGKPNFYSLKNEKFLI